MLNRRRFLASLAGLALTSRLASGQERRRSRWEMVTNNDPVSPAPFRPDPSSWDNTTITASWLGHSTVFINFFGTTIITDPAFFERIGIHFAGLFTLGPKRLVAFPLEPESLPKIDLILISHAHMDHLDTASLRSLDRSTPVVMAANTSDVIDGLGFDTVYELDWGQWTNAAGLRVEALEVKHFGWRFPWEQGRTPENRGGRSFNAYLLSKNGHHIVFGGDTAYHGHFAALRDRGLHVDLAMMPIGAYDPWIRNHANPEQALAMADQMNAAYILPIHWNTFIQSDEPVDEPLARLKRAAAAQPQRIALDAVGKTWSLPAAG